MRERAIHERDRELSTRESAIHERDQRAKHERELSTRES